MRTSTSQKVRNVSPTRSETSTTPWDVVVVVGVVVVDDVVVDVIVVAVVVVVVFVFFCTLLLSSFWTSRGHRCLSFSPPVLAFNFHRP